MKTTYAWNVAGVRGSLSQICTTDLIGIVRRRNLVWTGLGGDVSGFGRGLWHCGTVFGHVKQISATVASFLG